MKKFTALLAGALLMFTAVAANASYLTLSTAELLTATEVASNSIKAPDFLASNDAPNGVLFERNMGKTKNALGTVFSYAGVNAATFGLTDLTGIGNYQLSIADTNNSDWDVALFIRANGIDYLGAFTTLHPTGIFQSFSYNLAALGTDIDKVQYIGFAVESTLTGVPGNLTQPSNPDSYHINIAPVPEPGTMMLLGAGFLGLAIYGKRRKNA